MVKDKKKVNAQRVVKSHDVRLDNEYADWIREVKSRYRGAQIKAAVKVNSEQLLFNWRLGRDLVVRRVEDRWGAGVVEQVSFDLQNEFPEAKGFSARNLWYMKKWYQFYADGKGRDFLQQLVGEIKTVPSVNLEQLGTVAGSDVSRSFLQQLVAEKEWDKKLHQLGAEIEREGKLHQSGGEMDFPAVFAFVPWRHHVEIITHCHSVEEATFYLGRTIQEGWSRRALQNAIKANLFHSAGKALTNFGEVLPEAQGKLAQAISKDTYDLGFVSLPPEYDECALEASLEQNMTRFLLELGTGFAFVGRQKEIIVSGKTRKIDMLFYHIHLRCYVVIELKARGFEPEFAGKLNFYVNAVDDLMKNPDDNPTIGLLICKDKNQTEVQWALRGIGTPMGIATYDNVHIDKYLPSDEQITQRLTIAERDFIVGADRGGQ